VQNINFDSFTVDQLKEHLESRGLETNGKRKTLIKRLKEEVSKAWSQYYGAQVNPMAGMMMGGMGMPMPFPFQQPRPNKRKRTPLTEEQKAKIQEEQAEKRAKKEERRVAHEKMLKESLERKLALKQERAAKQAEIMREHKIAREEKQATEVLVKFDVKKFAEEVQKLVDKHGTVVSCNYDMNNKALRVRFQNAAQATKYAKNSRYNKPKNLKVSTTLQILPAPRESNCVFFLDPCSTHHPNCERAFNFCNENGVETNNQITTGTTELTRKAALKVFQKFGPIVNVYRERGFFVVHFERPASAKRFLSEMNNAGSLNGIPLVFVTAGTPRKCDKQECLKQYPMPAKKVKAEIEI